MRRLVAALALSLFVPALAGAQTSDMDQAVATITAEDFYRRVGVIAHDTMQGRNTPSAGLDMTAEWIASEFQRFGLRGGMEDGSFIQRYPLRSMALNVEASGFTASDGTRLGFGDDVLPLFGGVGDQVTTGGLVMVSGSAGTLTGASLEGKHVVMIPGADAGAPDRRLFSLLRAVRMGGAASIVVMNSTDEAEWVAQRGRALQASVRKAWDEDSSDGGRQATAPMLQIREASLRTLLAGTDVDLSALQARVDGPMEAHEVSGIELTLTVENNETEAFAPNVVAILEGSDPELKDEYVVFSGHMDHVGIGTPDENGDSIFNGADDDASGTIAVVEVAEALAALEVAPKRSMLFVIVSGEEKGLWGSEYFTENPTVPIEHMVANLNTDMVGRNWPDTIVAIGKEHSDLGETMNRINTGHPELGMTAIDDIWPEQNFYSRSDHFNFARKGVPILFFFNGTHDDYHGRDDEVERIDADKAARIARLVFYLGVDIGNAPERPKWNPESYERIVSEDF